MQLLFNNLPIVIAVLALLVNHQLGSERFPYVLLISTLACLAVFLITKRQTQKAATVLADSKLKKMEIENKNLKDNLMKVYNMLNEKSKETQPPPQPAFVPEQSGAKIEDLDSKPYA